MGFMKNEENQEVIAKSWIFPFVGLVALLGLAVLPVSRTSPEERVVRARAKAEVLAYQVAQLYKESLVSSPDEGQALTLSRGPASASTEQRFIPGTPSEGLMGQDPWGHAYSYRLQSIPDGKIRVEMRSAGPDGVPGSEPDDDVVLVLAF
ncbi:MAG: type II secretion system protein GspG [Bdellovibrionaceae bacterium]|nr:type II secretion system protein GspG [Pseudobdellovibrionaceae bacterium]MBX3034947.1 type II secretion system protein GspG [Pseudobdellovibrionaceae bacterium]